MVSHLKAQPNITLFSGFQGSGAYVWSPFVIKLEARLRFTGLSYRTEAGSLLKAPRGKIPYIAISRKDSDGQAPVTPMILGDSTLAVGLRIGQNMNTLWNNPIQEGVLDDLNAKLSPTEKAHDLALRALLEEKLYFYQCYEGWHENYYTTRSHILSTLPYPVQLVVGLLTYRKISQILYGQGTGRYSAEEISSFRQQIWENVDALLVASRRKNTETGANDTTFWVLGGNGPSEADTVLFGFIAWALVCTAAPETQKMVRSSSAVVDYARRIHNRYYPDYACWD